MKTRLYKFSSVIIACSCLALKAWAGPLTPTAAPNDVKTCYAGFTLTRNNLCVQEVNENPRTICSAGVLDGKGCRVEVPKVKRCAEGYSLDAAGECTHVARAELLYFCPENSQDNGEHCVISSPGEIISYCEEPAERVNDQCVLLKRAEPIIQTKCPEEALFEDNGCWKTAETFECLQECKLKPGATFGCERKTGLKQAPSLARTLGSEQVASHDKEINEKPSEKLKNSPVQHEKLIPATPPRHYRTVIVSQTCAKRYEVPHVTLQTCPHGYHMDKKGCFLQEITPLLNKCASNNGPPHACPRVVTSIPKFARCPNGSPPIKDKCFEVTKGELIAYCPSGYLENESGSCEGFIEPITKCDADLVYRNGKCSGRRTRQPIILSDPVAKNTSRTSNLKELKEIFNLKAKA